LKNAAPFPRYRPTALECLQWTMHRGESGLRVSGGH